jgi:hypothetical protein
MKNQTLKTILFWVFVLTISFWMNSCRSVKKDKTNLTEIVKVEVAEKENVIIKENSNLEKTEQIKTDSKTGTVTKKRVIRPIDPTKPASVINEKGEKKILENAEILEEESQINNQILSDKKSTLAAQKETLLEKQKSEMKKGMQKLDQEILKLERKGFSWLNLFWLLIPLGIIFAYKRYNGKIWWV